MAFASPACAEVWGFVDDLGTAHVANTQLDERYRLFFKGDTPRQLPGAASSAAEDAAADDSTAPPAPTDPLVRRLASDAGSQRFQHLIEQHANRQSVDPALVKAIVAAESGFAPGAISPKGARGLMQVMPQTAARYGVSSDRKRSAEDKLLDPAVNLQVGTRYLRDLLVRFADDIALTLAAYNAGEYAVERYNNRIPPYPETREYVQRVQQLYAAFRPAAAPPVQRSTAGAGLPQRRLTGTFLAQPKAAESPQEPVL